MLIDVPREHVEQCSVVFSPSQMQCVRFGYTIIVNGLFAATSAFTTASVF